MVTGTPIEEGGEFHADDAATHNDDVLGARGHVQQAGGIHHTGQVHAGNGDPGGAGASGHDQVVAGQVLTAGQMDRLSVRQGGVVGEHRDAVALLQEGHAVAHIVGVPLVCNLLENPTQLPEHLHIRHQGQQGQDIHHNRPQEPDGGDNQL